MSNNVCPYCGEILGQKCHCNTAIERLITLGHSYQDQGASEASAVGDFLVTVAESLDGEGVGEKEILEIADGSLDEVINWANAAKKEIESFKKEIPS